MEEIKREVFTKIYIYIYIYIEFYFIHTDPCIVFGDRGRGGRQVFSGFRLLKLEIISAIEYLKVFDVLYVYPPVSCYIMYSHDKKLLHKLKLLL
jgi:hypothetical protein